MGVIDILKGVFFAEDQLGNKERDETILLMMPATALCILTSGSQGLGIVKTGGLFLISRKSWATLVCRITGLSYNLNSNQSNQCSQF
jgi:hypothetical protein